MRRLACLAFVAAACSTNGSTTVVKSYPFGDANNQFTIQPGQEIIDDCVQITLGNEQDIYVNTVELTTGPGFHHSNWDFVPAEDPANGVIGAFPGPDGVFKCADRSFDEAVGAQRGGTLFAQSTQSMHEAQVFPDGAVIKIPKHSKLIANIHLLNTTDATLTLTPTIALTEVPEQQVTTLLSAMAFEDHALGLPPMMKSRFTVDCDFTTAWQTLYSKGNVASPTPDFHIYYALAHYHKLGTGLDIQAVRADDSATVMYETNRQVGDALGATMDPPFDISGYSRLKFACDFDNPRATTVSWGFGDQEMCVFLAFTDSPYLWGGGALIDDQPGPGTLVGDVMNYQASCNVYAIESSTH